jgi:hypothetical protein
VTTGSGNGFLPADGVAATYSRAAGENASPPTYHITATLSSTVAGALNNYYITNAGAEFTINKRRATWTTQPTSKTYGDADPVPLTTGSGTNFVAADGVTATYSRAAGENASPPTYHITATLSSAVAGALNNYDITNAGAEFTINKRRATWTTQPASKTYGDADPVPLTTGSGTNFVAADGVTATYSRVAGENASPPTYHITATLSASVAGALSNYDITNAGAEFTINKRIATWTTQPASKTYGDADPTPLTTGSGANFVAADGVTATYNRAAGENASPPTYHITATLTSAVAGALNNYDITNAGAEFTINKRSATWTTQPASKTYGDADPSPLTTGSGTNFVAADGVTATYSRVAGENASPPTYHITATLTAAVAGALNNYDITNAGAEFSISKRNATWTTQPASKTYGDADSSSLTTGSGTNFVAADGVTATYSRVAGENASPPTYHITATLSASAAGALNNYNITNAGAEFSISKRPITVTADAKNKVYGYADPSLTYQITSGSLASGDAFSGSLTRMAGENVGAYAILQGSLTAGPNYSLSYVGANLSITPRPVTIAADAKTKVYGYADPGFSYQITSGTLVTGDGFSGSLVRAPGENVGSYPIQVGTLALGGNYTLTYVPANLTIGPRPLTVTADAKAKFVNNPASADPALTYRVTNGSLAFTDKLVGALTRASGETAGSYAIMQGTLSAGTNYSLTYVGANLTIVAVSVIGPGGPLSLNTPASITATFPNTGTQAGPTCSFDWDDSTTTSGVLATTTSGNWSCVATRTLGTPGVYEVKVTLTDGNTGMTTVSFQYVVVFDPSGGFVTGGGWIVSPAGAYAANPTLTGKANFGFNSKYQKGANVPTGETEFQFSAAGFNFHSSVYDWLVVSGYKAQYKGTGTVNGTGNFGFLLTATDGKINGGGGIDKFRIKIWDKASGMIVYDNNLGAGDDIDAANPQALAGGSITIHK